MIEVIVSDLGQVILPFDFSPSRKFMAERRRSPHPFSEAETWQSLHDLHEQHEFGSGGCSPEEFYEHVVNDLQIDASYEEFCKAWSNVFREDSAVVDLIARARAKHRFLLSNTNSIHWQWILEHHGEALRIFDKLFASQEIRMVKPSEQVFRLVESETGLRPEAHLLVDDLAENIEGAIACGWDAVLHTDAANLERELRLRGMLD